MPSRSSSIEQQDHKELLSVGEEGRRKIGKTGEREKDKKIESDKNKKREEERK